MKPASFSEAAESSLGIAPGKWFWDTDGFQFVCVNALSGATAGQQLCCLTYSNNWLLILTKKGVYKYLFQILIFPGSYYICVNKINTFFFSLLETE